MRADRALMPGTRGYEDHAEALAARYESVAFEDKHRAILHLLPAAPAAIVDIGAGTGADAAWLAARGHAVVAVEPTRALRERGRALHPSPAIEWIDDGLPLLERIVPRGAAFRLVMLAAVWMHLDEIERRIAMPRVAALLRAGGALAMSLRHGPIPPGRRMFDVHADETCALAHASGLRTLLVATTPSLLAENRAAGVTWTCLAFERAASPRSRPP